MLYQNSNPRNDFIPPRTDGQDQMVPVMTSSPLNNDAHEIALNVSSTDDQDTPTGDLHPFIMEPAQPRWIEDHVFGDLDDLLERHLQLDALRAELALLEGEAQPVQSDERPQSPDRENHNEREEPSPFPPLPEDELLRHD